MDPRPGRIVDISRLLSRLNQSSPTGIDRVEFAYAQYYADQYRDGIVRFFITTPYFNGRISPFFARHIARLSLERWSRDDDPVSNRSFAELANILARPISMAPRMTAERIVEPRAKALDASANVLLLNAYYEAALGSTFQARRQREIQKRSWYLHLSHMNLDTPRRFRWIRAAHGQALFMVHDLLPISHPEYYPPDEARLHRRRIETIARLGSLVIFNSGATRKAWDDYVAEQGLPQPPGEVVPLGVDRPFLEGAGVKAEPAEPPYFVVVGTIEARKNLWFLLHIWREWVKKFETPPARLVIVGRRRSASESAVDMLERCPWLQSSVIEASEMADIRVAKIMKGARALLAPSLVEGFGLPIVEAMALGVPVVASDIPAHREAGGQVADYLDPVDGTAWIAALDDYVDFGSPRRQAALARLAAQKPRSWDDHIGEVESLLRDRNRSPDS